VNRQEKSQVIQELKEKVSQAQMAMVTDLKGMKVEEMTQLRVKLREQNIHYQVVKTTLARIAFTDTRHDVLKDKFKEGCAVALAFDDPVVMAKTLVEYKKANKKFLMRHGSLEGKFLSAEALDDLAKLPGKPEMLAKMLGTMNAVPTNFVGLFANVLRTFLYALNAIKDQKEGNA